MRIQLKSVLAAGCLLAVSAFGAAAFEATTLEPSELREGAGWDFAPIVELPEGSFVEVLNCDRSWCEVSVEDYDGFLPRGVLDLGGTSVPLYTFPPLFAAPSLWHGRYYSRDHYRHESRSRWRDRDEQTSSCRAHAAAAAAASADRAERAAGEEAVRPERADTRSARQEAVRPEGAGGRPGEEKAVRAEGAGDRSA